jgi:hypothetical protein
LDYRLLHHDGLVDLDLDPRGGGGDMSIESTRHAIAMMDKYGGSFVRALAAAWRYADPANRYLIESTWAGEFEKYAAFQEQA